MKIKLLKTLKPEYSPIEQVLYNRDIPQENFSNFIDFKYIFHSHNLLSNMDRAVNCVLYHLQNKSKIYCIVDSDCDGYTSTAILMSYLMKNFPDVNIDYIIHPGKEHGIILSEIPDDCKLLISPDGGSNDIEQQKALYSKGIDVVIFDHHEYDANAETPAIIVNSMNNYPNPYLCGVGVVYKFLEAMDEKLEISDAENYIDLCALGEVGDMMSLTNLETLSLIHKGLLNINNEFFKSLIAKQSFVMKDQVNPISIAFYIVPLINATTRSGTEEEKRTVFEAFLNPNKELASTKRGDKGNIELAKEQAGRYMTNCKSRQDKEVTKQRESIEQIIIKENLLDNKILTILIDYEINKNIVGLIANQIAAKYNRPTLILKKGEHAFSGSGRNPKYSEIQDLRTFLGELETTDYAAGHASAFGVSIPIEKFNDFVAHTNEAFKDVTYEDVLFADFSFNGKCNTGLISELNKYRYLYGQGMSEPSIAIYNLGINSSNCSIMGSKNDTIKITDSNGICYMLFRQSEESVSQFKELLRKGSFMINLVGRGNINEWMGRVTEQLFIDAFEVIDKPIF